MLQATQRVHGTHHKSSTSTPRTLYTSATGSRLHVAKPSMQIRKTRVLFLLELQMNINDLRRGQNLRSWYIGMPWTGGEVDVKQNYAAIGTLIGTRLEPYRLVTGYHSTGEPVLASAAEETRPRPSPVHHSRQTHKIAIPKIASATPPQAGRQFYTFNTSPPGQHCYCCNT